MRGNDPDAALYWCASMVAAGEDPTFIARRIVIAASEDVGNADPRALQVAVSAMQAVEMIGLPGAVRTGAGGRLRGSAPKSNRAGAAYFSALADVEEKGRLPVPLHLRPSAHRRLAREHGYGKGYLYPHDYDDADVDQQYLPDALVGNVYYEPSDQGLEQQIGERLTRLRRQRRARRQGLMRLLGFVWTSFIGSVAGVIRQAPAASASRCSACWRRDGLLHAGRVGSRSTRCTLRDLAGDGGLRGHHAGRPRSASCSRSSSCWRGGVLVVFVSEVARRPSAAPRRGSGSGRQSAEAIRKSAATWPWRSAIRQRTADERQPPDQIRPVTLTRMVATASSAARMTARTMLRRSRCT